MLYSEANGSMVAFLEILVSISESPRFDATTVIKLSLGSCFFQVRLSFQIYTTSMIKVVTIA